MNGRYKIMVDPVSYKKKPDGNEVASIQARLRNSSCIKELALPEILNYIGNGHTIVFGVFENGVRDENFVQQQLIGIDVDNKDGDVVKLATAISTLREKGINVSAHYFTFNNSNEREKYRLIVALNEPVKNLKLMRSILETITLTFSFSDPACKNPSRLFFGTDSTKQELGIDDYNTLVNIEDIIKLKQDAIIDSFKNEFSNEKDLLNLVKNFDFQNYLQKEGFEVERKLTDIDCYSVCPICGHRDCFRFYRTNKTYYCFSSDDNNGGNIINFLMATKKMNKKEAIEYFKHDLCGIDEDDEISLRLKRDYELITSNISKYSLDIVIPESLPWMTYFCNKVGHVEVIIKCQYLAEFMRNSISMIFINTTSNNKTPKYIYYGGKYNLISDNEFKGLIKAFIPFDICEPKHYKEVFDLLCTDSRYYLADKLNSDVDIINFENGILHLPTKQIIPHSNKILSTIQIPCSYKPIVEAPSTHFFDNFLNDLSNGDESIKKIILQCIGKALSNSPGYLEKASFLFIGPGNTGKSIFKLLLTELIGPENCSSVDLKDLEKPFSKIQLLNKRVAGTNDLSSMKISSLDCFKQLTGGDYINDAYKGMDAVDFRFKGLLILCGNQLPVFGGDKGNWVYDRMIIIPCENVIPPEKRNKNLLNDLLSEKEYIVSLAIEQLYNVLAKGYDIPQKCINLKESYKVTNNSVLVFQNECMQKRTDKFIHDTFTCGKTYVAYKKWYIETHRDRFYESRTSFREIMGGEDAIIKTNSGNEYYKNMVLTEKAAAEYLEDYCDFHFTDDDSNYVEVPNDYDDIELPF